MSTHAPVIAAVDGSDHSLVALEWAMGAAALRGAEVLAVHVRDDSSPDGTHPAPAPDPVRDRVEEFLAGCAGSSRTPWRVETFLAGRAESLREQSARTEPAVRVTYSAVDGDSPAEALAEVAAKAQLLVAGSRGRGGFAALLLGSTGRKLAMRAPCPLVIVPHEARTAERPTTPGPEQVVLGLAPDETSDATIAFAFEEAERGGAELQVISAYFVPLTSLSMVGELVDTTDTVVAEGLHDAQTARLAPFRTRHPSVRVDQLATAGDPAGRLVNASRTAALTVLGRHRRRLTPESFLLGSVTHAVLHHAHGPVAVIPGS